MKNYVLNARDAAAFLSISVSTLYRLTADGKISKVFLSAKRVGWKRDELIRFANSD